MSTNSNYIQQYPANVVPQQRSPMPSEPLPCLTCPPNDELQAIIISGTELAVVRGWEWRSNINLGEFFQPCENYSEYQVLLKTQETLTLNYGPIADSNGNVNFITLYPMYHQTNIDLQSDWKMKWRNIGDTNWNGLGRILMLSGTVDFPVKPIEIINTSPADVEIKILVSK